MILSKTDTALVQEIVSGIVASNLIALCVAQGEELTPELKAGAMHHASAVQYGPLIEETAAALMEHVDLKTLGRVNKYLKQPDTVASIQAIQIVSQELQEQFQGIIGEIVTSLQPTPEEAV